MSEMSHWLPTTCAKPAIHSTAHLARFTSHPENIRIIRSCICCCVCTKPFFQIYLAICITVKCLEHAVCHRLI